MAQSSALRKEATAPNPTPITIDGNYVPNPKHAAIGNDGSLTFNCAKPTWLYTSPTGVFGDSQGKVKLVKGPNDPIYPQKPNVTVDYCSTAANTTCSPKRRVEDGGNTIKVGN